MKCRKINLVNVEDFNEVIKEVYCKHYSFQHQGARTYNGVEESYFLKVPYIRNFKDFDSGAAIEECIYNNEQILQYGVEFNEWLNKDPNFEWYSSDINNKLIWERYYYPHIYMLINDLYIKGLIEAGEYCIKMY